MQTSPPSEPKPKPPLPIELDEAGRPILDSIDQLNVDDLSTWVRRRLHDADTAVPDHPRRPGKQYYLIGALYPDLKLSTQASVRRVVKRCFAEMARGNDEWTGPAAHNLLLLAKNLGEPELAPPIAEMARNDRFLPTHPDLHARLLQTLIFLGSKQTPEFWHAQLHRDPDRFGVYAFLGLRLHTVYQALAVLDTLDLKEEDMRRDLRMELGGFLAIHGLSGDQLREEIDDMWGHLSGEAQDLIRTALPEIFEEDEHPDANPRGGARGALATKGYSTKEESLFAMP